MKVLLSIPIHENWACVVNQIDNVLNHFREATIILHLSQNFRPRLADWIWKLVKYDERVHINPQSLPTRWGNLVHVHLANFQFASTLGSFDYFAMHASNDMFIRRVASSIFKENSCGFQCQPTTPQMDWDAAKMSRQDQSFSRILNHIGTNEIIGSQIEGTYYSSELFKEISAIINKFYSFGDSQFHYCREEIYFPTVALKLHNRRPSGLPYCYSSVVKGEISVETVNKLLEGKLNVPEWGFNGGSPLAYRHYDLNQIYAVKRVPRQLFDPLRRYISRL